MRRIVPLILALVIGGLVFYFLTGMGGVDTASSLEPIELPESLGAFKQTGVQLGKEAMNDFQRQHQKKIPIRQGARGEYSDGTNKLELWAGSGTSEAHAKQMISDMTKTIGKANLIFTEPKLMAVPGGEVHKTIGQERANYYFVKANNVYWVAITAPDPDAVIREIFPAFYQN